MGREMKETDDDCDRLNRRRTVLLQGRCRKSSWEVFDVELDNLSEGGCCIVGSSELFEPRQSLSLRFANTRNIEASVRWVTDDRVGVEFRVPLKRRIIEDLGIAYGITCQEWQDPDGRAVSGLAGLRI